MSSLEAECVYLDRDQTLAGKSSQHKNPSLNQPDNVASALRVALHAVLRGLRRRVSWQRMVCQRAPLPAREVPPTTRTRRSRRGETQVGANCQGTEPLGQDTRLVLDRTSRQSV